MNYSSTFVRREIDIGNLRTLFRLKREGLEHDKIMGYMIPGGAKLTMDDLRKLAQALTYDDFVNMLKEYPYWNDISEAVEKSRETGSLNAIEIALRKSLIAFAEKISHLYPLSITPDTRLCDPKEHGGQQSPHHSERQRDTISTMR